MQRQRPDGSYQDLGPRAGLPRGTPIDRSGALRRTPKRALDAIEAKAYEPRRRRR